MKKQDNETLIQEVTKRLDWYTMEASDEEFDADEVQTLLKLLDSLKGEEKEEENEKDFKFCTLLRYGSNVRSIHGFLQQG